MSRAAFSERLDLLEQSQQVTAHARRLTEQVIDHIEAEYNVELNEANAAQFVTHLAMALGRLDRGEVESEIPEVVEDEIRDRHRERALTRRVLEDCGRSLGRTVPEAEISYMTIHLCVLADAQLTSG